MFSLKCEQHQRTHTFWSLRFFFYFIYSHPSHCIRKYRYSTIWFAMCRLVNGTDRLTSSSPPRPSRSAANCYKPSYDLYPAFHTLALAHSHTHTHTQTYNRSVWSDRQREIERPDQLCAFLRIATKHNSLCTIFIWIYVYHNHTYNTHTHISGLKIINRTYIISFLD